MTELETPPETPETFPETPTTPTLGTSGACDLGLDDFYTRDEFYECFKSGFQFAGDTLKIQSLPIRPEEELGARKTADKLYNAASKYKFLEFMINKKSGWIADTALVVLFVTRKTKDVIEEKASETVKKKFFGGLLKWLPGKKASASVSSAQVAAEKQPTPAA